MLCFLWLDGGMLVSLCGWLTVFWMVSCQLPLRGTNTLPGVISLYTIPTYIFVQHPLPMHFVIPVSCNPQARFHSNFVLSIYDPSSTISSNLEIVKPGLVPPDQPSSMFCVASSCLLYKGFWYASCYTCFPYIAFSCCSSSACWEL